MDVLNSAELVRGGTHELLGGFLRDFLPIDIYEEVLTGKVSVYDMSVAIELNEVFLSYYLPACRNINAGQYAPTHDIEYEFRMRAYDLCGIGLIPEWFFDRAISIR